MNLNIKKFMLDYTEQWLNGNPLSPKEVRRLLNKYKNKGD